MTAAVKARRMHAVVDKRGGILLADPNEAVAIDCSKQGERVAPVMVISIAEYVRLKAKAGKGRRS